MRSVSGRALLVAAVALSRRRGCRLRKQQQWRQQRRGRERRGRRRCDSGQLVDLRGTGGGSGKYEIVSDLPMQGASSHQTKQMVQAIELSSSKHNYKVNGMTIQYQAVRRLDRAGWERGTPATCSANANAYARMRP